MSDFLEANYWKIPLPSIPLDDLETEEEEVVVVKEENEVIKPETIQIMTMKMNAMADPISPNVQRPILKKENEGIHVNYSQFTYWKQPLPDLNLDDLPLAEEEEVEQPQPNGDGNGSGFENPRSDYNNVENADDLMKNGPDSRYPINTNHYYHRSSLLLSQNFAGTDKNEPKNDPENHERATTLFEHIEELPMKDETIRQLALQIQSNFNFSNEDQISGKNREVSFEEKAMFLSLYSNLLGQRKPENSEMHNKEKKIAEIQEENPDEEYEDFEEEEDHFDNNKQESLSSYYSQEELAEFDLNSRRLDVFVIFFNDFLQKYHTIQDLLRFEMLAISKACEELMTSDKLTTIFGLILTLQNRMNQQEGKGESNGFKIRELNVLLNQKSINGETRLINYVAHLLEKRFPGTTSFLANDLPSLIDAYEGCKRSIQASTDEMEKGKMAIKSELSFHCHAPEDYYDPRIRRMQDFLNQTEEDVDEIQQLTEQANSAIRKAKEFFGEDDNNMSTEEFFEVFTTFAGNLDAACKENLNSKMFSN